MDDCDAVVAVFVVVDELIVFNEASSFNDGDITVVDKDNEEDGDGDDNVNDDDDDSDDTITLVRSIVFINSPFKIQT